MRIHLTKLLLPLLLGACGQAGPPQNEKVENKPEVVDPAPENPESLSGTGNTSGYIKRINVTFA